MFKGLWWQVHWWETDWLLTSCRLGRYCKHQIWLSLSLKWYCFSDTGFIIIQARAGLMNKQVISSSRNITVSMCCVSVSSVTFTFIVCFIQSQWHHTFNSALIKSVKWPRSTDVYGSPPLYKQEHDSWQTIVFHGILKSPTSSGPCPWHSVMTLLCFRKELFKEPMGKLCVSLNVPWTSLSPS